jgi:hypothetical protein
MERCTGGPSEEGTSALLLKLDPKERFRRTAIRESLHGQARGRRPGEEGLNEGSEEPTLGALRWMSPALVPPRRGPIGRHPWVRPSKVSPKRGPLGRHPVRGYRHGTSEEEPLGQALGEVIPCHNLEEKMAVEVLGVSISRGSGSEEPQPGEVPG